MAMPEARVLSMLSLAIGGGEPRPAPVITEALAITGQMLQSTLSMLSLVGREEEQKPVLVM